MSIDVRNEHTVEIVQGGVEAWSLDWAKDLGSDVVISVGFTIPTGITVTGSLVASRSDLRIDTTNSSAGETYLIKLVATTALGLKPAFNLSVRVL